METNETLNIPTDVFKSTISDLENKFTAKLETAIQNTESKFEREIKSNVLPQVIQPNIEVKSENVDKTLLGSIARVSAKSFIERLSFNEALESITKDNAYLRNAIQKTMTVADTAAGGYLVPNYVASEMIAPLKAASVVRAAGARVVPMPNGNATYRKWNTGSAPSSVGEGGSPATMDISTGTVTLSAKKLFGEVIISNELLNDTSGLIDAYIQENMIYQLSKQEDTLYLSGLGTSYQPKGIITAMASGSKNAQTATPDLDKARKDIVKAVTTVRKNNVPMIKGGWILSPSNFGALSGGTSTNFATMDFFKSLQSGQLFGYPVYVTTNIADDTILFGDFGMALIGETQGINITSSAEIAFRTDETVIRATMRTDFALLHDVSFSAITGVTWASAL